MKQLPMRQKMWSFLALGSFVLLVIWGLRRTQQMQQRGKYTIGYVTGWMQTLKSGRAITYRCLIAGVTYHSSELEKQGMDATKGTRYVVVFDSLAPKDNAAYYDQPVPDSAGLPPPAGWTPHQFALLSAAWQQADSLQRARLISQQDSEQLVRWQQANRP